MSYPRYFQLGDPMYLGRGHTVQRILRDNLNAYMYSTLAWWGFSNPNYSVNLVQYILRTPKNY